MQRTTIMKLTLVLLTAVAALVFSSGTAAARGEFGLKEFDKFHDILHGLQHKAVPENDFKLLRLKASGLVERGNDILEIGPTRGVKDRAAYAALLSRFKTALNRYEQAALDGPDTELVSTFSAVHDLFEELAAALPRRHKMADKH
jgi:hypothetical protein